MGDKSLNCFIFPSRYKTFDIAPFQTLNDEQRLRLLAIRNDERVRKWMYTRHEITQSEHESFFTSLDTSETSLHFALLQEGKILGAFNFQRLNLLHAHTYFGMYADPDAPVPGLGFTIDEIAEHFAFDIIGLHALRLEVIASNISVIALHKRMGFTQEAELLDYVKTDEGWENVLIMGKLRGNAHG